MSAQFLLDDYPHRANIEKNKPQTNPKTKKKFLIHIEVILRKIYTNVKLMFFVSLEKDKK
ncbi:hypothetical protein HC766_00455 [Candidatus Gracilibacteria bacterium]|nr:hypothetical protein [Candidatus Gracilibacteria bacterium]